MNNRHHLKQTADQIKKIRPSYEPIVDFYAQVFLAQDRFKEQIDFEAITIDQDILKIKQKDQMPLIDQSEFMIHLSSAKELLLELCDIAYQYAPKLANTSSILKQALLESEIDLDTFFSAILNDQDNALSQMASVLDIPVDQLVMFGYLGMAPSIEMNREQLEYYLKDDTDFKKGYCPVCGNQPELAFLDKDGKRHLQCCFCHHQWPVERMGCVFCENNEDGKQHYFYSEEEKEYRVYLCDHCQNYIKVVDLRQMDRNFISSLEMVCTLHLDMKAKDKGYLGNADQNHH